MQVRTGKIQEFDDGQIPAGFVPVDPVDMTQKQMREMQVSMHDNRSKLGKVFGMNRAQRRAEMRRQKKSSQERG